jgi:hypothetical protein
MSLAKMAACSLGAMKAHQWQAERNMKAKQSERNSNEMKAKENNG